MIRSMPALALALLLAPVAAEAQVAPVKVPPAPAEGKAPSKDASPSPAKVDAKAAAPKADKVAAPKADAKADSKAAGAKAPKVDGEPAALPPPGDAAAEPAAAPAEPARAGGAPPGDAPPPLAPLPASAPPPPSFAAQADAAALVVDEEEGDRHEGVARARFFRLSLAPRFNYVTGAGYDPYSETNLLGQWSFDATYAFFEQGKVSLAVGAAWDVGGSTADARQIRTSITTHRLTVPIEARYRATEGMYGFARVAPGAAASLASIDEPSSSETLEASKWVGAADLSAGASFLLGPRKPLARRGLRFWITPELGYGWSGAATLQFSPRNDDELVGTQGTTRLGSFAQRGFFWRLGVAMTY